MSAESESPKKKRARPWLRRALWVGGLMGASLTLFVAVVVIDGWEALGKGAEGERRAAMEASPQWEDGGFENPQPLWNDVWGGVSEGLSGNEFATPAQALPVQQVDPKLFDTPPASGLRVTWLGHSTMLLEIDGHRFLTDPVWGPRTSPVDWLGPERWYAPPLAIEDLPKLDAIVLSHDHYDHLDYPTIVALKDLDTTFVAPLGVTAHLEYWGVPAERIVEVDWGTRHSFGDLGLVVTPSRHASGRQVFDQNRTLWAGYAFKGIEHSVYFSGDTGLFPDMEKIGKSLGPFDLTMIEVGAYAQSWPDWHLGPEQAVEANQMVRGKVLLPVHWGLFNLAPHGWTEPVERVGVAAKKIGLRVAYPKPGESFEPGVALPTERWWPDLEWRTAEEYPVRARGL